MTPGSVAIRAPRRVASLRARVWLSEQVVGAKTTAASAIASATNARRLLPVTRQRRIHDLANAAGMALGDRRERLGDDALLLVEDDEHVLAGVDSEAAHRRFGRSSELIGSWRHASSLTARRRPVHGEAKALRPNGSRIEASAS